MESKTELQYTAPSKASAQLGLSTKQLRALAQRRELPEGSVIASPGGTFYYDVEMIRGWMLDNYLTLTRRRVKR